ncbi:MAG: outer membrane lipoprotein-sorting protein [Lentisphaerae bacterium]|nr:outer membrane lipoprotein-sorting protein [Lentisphaerota bacterium]
MCAGLLGTLAVSGETPGGAPGRQEGVVSAADADEPPQPEPPPLNAGAVLAGTLERLPTSPVTLRGEMIVRRQRGVVLRQVPFAIHLDWGAPEPRAEYRLSDSFGRVEERITAIRQSDGSSLLTWHREDGTPATNPPALSDPVRDTDLTWLDLTLAFLWWPGATLAGEADFRGSLCDIVQVVPPTPLPGCGAMRLWIDRRLRFLRQAEQLDEDGTTVRRMWVSRVGKIGERWMIRDMEVERPGAGQRTKLHVEDLDTP